MFILNFYLIYELVNNNCTNYEWVCFTYKGKFHMHVNYNLISIKFVITWELKFIIIHAWSLLVEVFFKGVHQEFEKKPIHIYYPCWIIHFISCVSAKYLSPFPINPIPHKIKRLFFYWWKFLPIFLR
jgi:hypothetical protein